MLKTPNKKTPYKPQQREDASCFLVKMSLTI